jgi:predicted nucleic acid-binding protein
VRAWAAALPLWCEVRCPASLEGTEGLAHLGAGEREAIVLAQELRAGVILISIPVGEAEG